MILKFKVCFLNYITFCIPEIKFLEKLSNKNVSNKKSNKMLKYDINIYFTELMFYKKEYFFKYICEIIIIIHTNFLILEFLRVICMI